jgi:hypothetical protein
MVKAYLENDHDRLQVLKAQQPVLLDYLRYQLPAVQICQEQRGVRPPEKVPTTGVQRTTAGCPV